MTTGRWIWLGFLGGLLGGVFMAMVEMGNNLIVGHSAFTPMHMIAAPVVGMGAMERAMTGGPLYMEPVPAILGMMGHFMWAGLIWGSLFGLLAAGLRLIGTAALGWGLVYGLLTGFVMSLVVLPIFGMKPLWESDGWVPFILMHLAYGLGPGFVVWRGTLTSSEVAAAKGRNGQVMRAS